MAPQDRVRIFTSMKVMNKETIAQFTVTNKVGEVIKQYSIPTTYGDELTKVLKEARQTWSEYYVQMETDLFIQSFSHTYSEEVLMNNK